MSIPEELIKACLEFHMSNDKLKEVMRIFRADIEKGLAKATHASAAVKCYVTYVQDLPDGTESGKFMALDLGGTNFRVLVIKLGDHQCDIEAKKFKVPEEKMVGPGEDLFDYVADCIVLTMTELDILNEKMSLGFTFSFPLAQVGLSKGILQQWTKGFNCSGVVGEDVVALMRKALEKRKEVNVEVTAILNDTTGTLMSCAWKNSFCKIGLIIGTGTNACYVEKQANAPLFDEADNGSGVVVINTEWGAFGVDGSLDFLKTDYDKEIDAESINPGQQIHEKMISGMYMGELVRLAIVKFIKDGLMLGEKYAEPLSVKNCITTEFVSEIESDPVGEYENCRRVMGTIGVDGLSDTDCCYIRYVCQCVSRRAAYLVSAGLSVLLQKMDYKNITVGVDGGLYINHPHFHNLMMTKMKELIGTSKTFSLMLSEDGSGRGAALVAAGASKSGGPRPGGPVRPKKPCKCPPKQ